MQSLTQPTLLLKPFAENGDKNSIPVENTDAQNPQLADLTNGFPSITSDDPDDGGLPPERKDFNGLGYLTTTYDYFYQAGGTFTFNPTVSSAIGGYPQGARLWYTDSNGATSVLRSTIGNNTDNFNDGQGTGIGTTWVKDTPTFNDINGILKTLYPVGSIYIGTQSTCPLETLISGSTWEKVEGRYLLASGTMAGTDGETYSADQYVSAGMPNHKHYLANGQRAPTYTKPVNGTLGDSSNGMGNNDYSLCGFSDISTYAPNTFLSSNAVYDSTAGEIAGNAKTIRPTAYVVNVWRRTA